MVGNACAKLIPESANAATKVCCVIATGAVSGIAGAKVYDYIDELTNEVSYCITVVKEINEIKKSKKKEMKEERKQKKEEAKKSKSDTESVVDDNEIVEAE